MTTAVPVTIKWIDLVMGGEKIEIAPLPGIEPRLLVDAIPYEGYLEPLTRGPDPEVCVSVDLVLTETGPGAWLVAQRCEAEARRVAEALGALLSPTAALRNFSLEAALGGEGLPYNRMSVPQLALRPGEPHAVEERGERAVRIFTATALADDNGTKYTLRHG
ncbi:hypothetical protein [Streptomyces ortus]|uniref:Uncharacterized protein n=1 Tax=Streptomyces ortus TaxID=2867268 RepID=A0ABT3UWM5_9ACTN|nr:hypothetical protein [Streptomyces ortus]MCX4231974.1 hypothetical protein [Streptomyces ortus]